METNEMTVEIKQDCHSDFGVATSCQVQSEYGCARCNANCPTQWHLIRHINVAHNLQSEKYWGTKSCGESQLHKFCHSLVNELEEKTEENSSLQKELNGAKSQLERLQHQLKTAMDVELKCAICGERMIEAVVSGKCGHFFCKSCINRWIEVKPECPTCRSKCNRTAPAVAIQQLHEKLLDCIDAESRQKYAEAVEERKSTVNNSDDQNHNLVDVPPTVRQNIFINFGSNRLLFDLFDSLINTPTTGFHINQPWM